MMEEEEWLENHFDWERKRRIEKGFFEAVSYSLFFFYMQNTNEMENRGENLIFFSKKGILVIL